MNNPDKEHKNDSSLDMNQSQNELTLDNFILKNKIGSGSFGKVYLAEKKETGEIFAVKITRQKFDEYSEDDIRDLLREINIISKLSHPHVMKYVGYCRKDFKNKPRLVIITEYVSKGTLKDIIESEQNDKNIDGWNDTRKLIIIYGIASAMSYLHSHDIIHRDLKPSNILIDENFLPIIADFGFSKIMENKIDNPDMKSTMEIKGTPIYMSPEIWHKQEYTKACDVYAFGIIMYEILTSDKPYKNPNFYEIAGNIINGIRPEFKKPIPKSYKNLIESCWSQDPADRPTFDEILQKLIVDHRFITKSIDYDEYIAYIEYIDKYKDSIKITKNVSLNDLIESDSDKVNNYQKIDDGLNMYMKALEEFPSLFNIFSYQYFRELSDKQKKLILDAENDLSKKFLIGKSIIEGRELFIQCADVGIKYLERSIKDGCYESLIYYCELLIKGKILPQNLKKAKKLIQPLRKNHSNSYMLLYGKILKKEKNYAEAKQCFEQLIKEKNGNAMYEYGKMLYKGFGSQVNKEGAIQYYIMAIENNCLKAIYKYAKAIKDEDINKYYEYIKIAADKNIPEALFCYSLMLEKGEGVQIDKEESLIYLEKAAYEGHEEAMLKYALILTKEKDQDMSTISKIFFLMVNSFNKGNIKSLYQLGKFLNDFLPSEKNIKDAAKYIRIAANCGEIEAMTMYGNILIEGNGVDIDKEEGMKYLKSAADKGETKAMNDYGIQLMKRNESNDKEEAMKYFEMAIKKGDYAGIGNYGLMLIENDDQSDFEEGVKFLKMAADNGDECFAVNYGNVLLDDFVDENVEEALKYFKKAAEKGVLEAMSKYGILSIGGFAQIEIQSNQKEEGIRYIKKAADEGYLEAILNYSKMLMYGIGVSKNKEEAYDYLEKAVDEGHIKAIVTLAEFLLNDDETDYNNEKAIKYFKIAADKGSSEGMKQYANMLFDGIGTPKNKKEALKYYKQAIDNGETDIIQRYAIMLYTGDGVPIDKDEAVKYFKIGIDNDDPLAMNNYGNLLLNYETLPEKIEEGIKYIKLAADKGYALAMSNYACLLTEEFDDSVNLEESERYFKMAIENGSMEATFKYGKMLYEGDCFPEDKIEGCKYLKIAAQNGFAEALGLYGHILEIGDGVPENKEEAIRLYQEGISKGDCDSMYYYGRLLYDESKDPKDKDEGLKLIKMAADHGSYEAIIKYSFDAKNNDLLDDDDNSFGFLDLFYNNKHANDLVFIGGVRLFNSGDPEEKKSGLDAIKRAADNGNVDAMFQYAQILEKNEEYATDKEEIVKYYKMASENGHKNAMLAYDNLLLNENRCEKKEESLNYIKLSEEKVIEDDSDDSCDI